MKIRLIKRQSDLGAGPTFFIAATALFLVAVVSRADVIYASNTGYGTVERYDSASGSDLGAFVNNGLILPTGLAFDRAGNLYVASGYSAVVSRITPAGILSVFANTGYSFGGSGLAFDGAGNLYAANDGNSVIQRFTPDGHGSVFASTFPGVGSFYGLAFDSAGNLFSTFGNTIQKFTTDGHGSVFANSGLGAPGGLAFDQAGNLYVANTMSNTVVRFTPGGSASIFASSGLNQPNGLAFDSAGNLYVSNYDFIERFTPDGIGSVFATTGAGSYPTFIAIQVPEPSVCTLLGLALLAWAAHGVKGLGGKPRVFTSPGAAQSRTVATPKAE